MFVNPRDLVWSMPPRRMVGGVVKQGASLSSAFWWTGSKRCQEYLNCNWFNYEGRRCRLFQCRGNTWGQTTNSFAGPKWKHIFCPKIFCPQDLRLVQGRSRWGGFALWWGWAKQRCLLAPQGTLYFIPYPTWRSIPSNPIPYYLFFTQHTGWHVQSVVGILAIVVFACWLYHQSFPSIWPDYNHWLFDIVWIY